MPRVSDLSESKYLAKKDAESPILGKIARYTQEDIEGEEGTKTKYVLYFEGVDKGMVLGPTTGTQIEDVTGSDDLDNWIGKTIEIYVDHSIMFGGNRVGGLRVRKPTNGVSSQHQTAPQNDLVKTAKQDAWRAYCKKHGTRDVDWWKANFTVAVDTYFQGMNPNAINLAQWRKFIDDGFEPKAPLQLAEAGAPGGFADDDIPF